MVAYGPDEILYALLLAGSAGLALDLPVAVPIAALLAIVAFSYRHTYPRGGGFHNVVRENLGIGPGLVVAAALMVDYLSTVAVSLRPGWQRLSPSSRLKADRIVLGVALIVVLFAINLRGVRDSGRPSCASRR